MTTHKTRRVLATTTAAAMLTAGLFGAGTASAVPEHPHGDEAPGQGQGRTVPAEKISIQLFSYLGWTLSDGFDTVVDELEEIGYRNVEPFSSPGSVFYGGNTAAELRVELRERGMSAPTTHGNVSEASFDAALENAKDLGQRYVGSGGWPGPGIARDGSSTYEDVLETAAAMDRLGERSVKNGTGKIFGHNHQWEFTTTFEDPETGETKSAWEVLVENTDPRYVTFQLDTFWAADAGADVVELLEEHGDRVELLHIKDGDLNGDERGIPGDVGEGDMEWGPILRAAHGKVKLYVVERDGAPSTPEFAEDSFEFLTSFRY
ncbi:MULTISPECIES: sugar phosphate isomerase/epimerase [unclassified Isoptericola]|uniref:sugar phosphate isomerase/epimerase family protein n=1 Tax=unclassified Isoptericola TaxID=2623355 RepID=UPI002712DBCD|nr:MULTISPECIES: sugar phosphate isomerase/epimerase [unclassified Isoptericola]MDO8145739.1 sugar phosphate isomerase/epimerase [Isoptericola sp. 178]MDO8147920.1 sugar phosphate isomerase/epimerase [Isoptericola sp. b515]